MMAHIHIHIGTKDDDTWLDKDIQALTAAIQAVGMASPIIRSRLKPIMMEELEKLKKMKASGGEGR
jgi:hypothetical protein